MDIKNTLKNVLTDTSSLLGIGFDEASNLLKDTLDKFYDVKNLTKEKLTGFTNDLIALSPLIEKTGFRTKEINIGVGVPPRIIFHFEKFANVSKSDIEALLKQHEDKTMLKVIVTTLVSADEFQSKLTLGSFKFNEIDIELGVPPEVNVKLVNSSALGVV
ncbi:MAG: hypothetical protein IPI31_18170 [Bacteroidetes bacterium]|jgi:hypothetical protein|nr:hypothetical protein [Bacteroidota bacterium]MBP9795620.1 hypothetical protein [Chitinophagales bacterium]